ncbi:hypothetical protein SDC9_173787 [bioreactor metagenome]|uniref:Uncharacterized protein n=1 Tax=bioreactor metagenome TaxID=1076179 RepID=A0A645GRV7_9ZZZZ
MEHTVALFILLKLSDHTVIGRGQVYCVFVDGFSAAGQRYALVAALNEAGVKKLFHGFDLLA